MMKPMYLGRQTKMLQREKFRDLEDKHTPRASKNSFVFE